MSETKSAWQPAGKGLAIWEGEAVEGTVVEVRTVQDVLSLMDAPPDEMIVLTHSASATILAPLYDVAVGIICTAGTVGSHVAIISREYGLPCLMGVELNGADLVGRRVRLASSGEVLVNERKPGAASTTEAPLRADGLAAGCEDDFPILHFVRLKGIVDTNKFPEVASPEAFERLVDNGLLRKGKRGVMLSERGLQAHQEVLSRQRQALDLHSIASAYERFLAVNQPVKDVCAKWQASEGDDECLFITLGELNDFLDRVRPALKRAGAACSRFIDYIDRLEAALEEVQRGDSRYLTTPSVDSFHNIWFECHEDYLLTLGRDRETEEGA